MSYRRGTPQVSRSADSRRGLRGDSGIELKSEERREEVLEEGTKLDRSFRNARAQENLRLERDRRSRRSFGHNSDDDRRKLIDALKRIIERKKERTPCPPTPSVTISPLR
jgi:hypothetical protein